MKQNNKFLIFCKKIVRLKDKFFLKGIIYYCLKGEKKVQNKLKFNNNFNLSFKKDKKQHFFLSFFSLYLVLVCVILPVFSFTACAENGTFYVGIMATRNNLDIGTEQSANFRAKINVFSQEILRAMEDRFGFYELDISRRVKDNLDIIYDLKDSEAEELNSYFDEFGYFTYCEYRSDLGVKNNVLVLSNKELSKTFIEDNIVQFNPEKTGTFTCSLDYGFWTSEEMTRLSNVDSETKVEENEVLPTDNVYKFRIGLFDSSNTKALVFLGNKVGGRSFAEISQVKDFITKFYNSVYGSIERFVTIPSTSIKDRPVAFNINHWIYSFSSRGEDSGNIVNYYYKDLSVFICRYLLTGDTDPESLKDIIFDNRNTMYDEYLKAEQNLYQGEYATTTTDYRDWFVEASCQFLFGVSSLGDASEGGVADATQALYQEMVGDNFIKDEKLNNDYFKIFLSVVQANSTFEGGDYNFENSPVYFYDNFKYNGKDDLVSMKLNKSIMAGFAPVRALVFQSWDMSDTLDAVVVNFEYYQEGKTDEETQANKERAWEILKNYNFIVRYSVISNVGTPQRAQSVILDKEQFVDQGELEDGVLFLDLYTIFETHFKDQFKGYSSEGFFLRDLNTEAYEGFEPFDGNFYSTTFNSGSMGVGVYYDGMVRDNSIPEYYFEIIFAAPGYNQVLNFKITDIFL